MALKTINGGCLNCGSREVIPVPYGPGDTRKLSVEQGIDLYLKG